MTFKEAEQTAKGTGKWKFVTRKQAISFCVSNRRIIKQNNYADFYINLYGYILPYDVTKDEQIKLHFSLNGFVIRNFYILQRGSDFKISEAIHSKGD